MKKIVIDKKTYLTYKEFYTCVYNDLGGGGYSRLGRL